MRTTLPSGRRQSSPRLAPRPGTAAAALGLLLVLGGCDAPTATRTGTGGAGGGAVTAVYSRASKDYHRVQNPDGSFQPETYLFKNGGNFGGPATDSTIDPIGFDEISRVVSLSLAKQAYVPSDDRPTTRLLIVVYWGRTVTPGDADPYDGRESRTLKELAVSEPSIAAALYANAAQFGRDETEQDATIDARSANILGYTDEIFRTSPHDPKLATLRDEVEESRFYVVLLAYDYQMARQFGQHRLLWETRFSIPQRGNDFEKAFPLMVEIASRYFGQDSHGLIHHGVDDGRVEIGEPKSLGTLPQK